MFGYVKCAPEELRVREWNRYRAYYCGVCRGMGKFTALGRCVLSYDLAFYALLMDYPAQCEIHIKRCGWNMKKKPYAVGAAVDYAAVMNVILSWGKLQDDIADRDGAKRALAMLLRPASKKAANLGEAAYSICETKLSELQNLEQQGCDSVDIMADCFATMCAQLCAEATFLTDESVRRVLYQIGYSVARWVYIIDALDDLKNDEQKGSYNPILQEIKSGRLQEQQVNTVMQKSLYNTLLDALRATQLLPNSENKPIILNIVQYGLADVTKKILTQTEGN